MISIDGNVYTGKTTLSRAIAKRTGRTHVPEHSAFVRSHDGSLWDAHAAYLDAELARAGSFSADAVLDRSVLSLAAHVYAAHATGLGDMREHFCDWLRSYPSALPSTMIALVAEPELVRRRTLKGESEQPKGTVPFLFSIPYLRAVNEFYRRLSEISPLAVIDASQDEDAIIEQALAIPASSPAGMLTAIQEVLR
jgi:hypothetical protein